MGVMVTRYQTESSIFDIRYKPILGDYKINVSAQWKCVSEAFYNESKEKWEWTITRTLYLKNNIDKPLSDIVVRYDFKNGEYIDLCRVDYDEVKTGEFTAVRFREIRHIDYISSYIGEVIDGKYVRKVQNTEGYVRSEEGDSSYYENICIHCEASGTGIITGYSAGSDAPIPWAKYGGIDEGYPSVVQCYVTPTEHDANVYGTVLSSYECDVNVSLYSGTPYGTHTLIKAVELPGKYILEKPINFFIGELFDVVLDAYSSYYVVINVECENQKSISRTSTFTTKPTLITDIVQADVYVDENETVTVTPTIVPNDASIKRLSFEREPSDTASYNYYLDSQNGTSATITGRTRTNTGTPAVLYAKTNDGSNIKKKINVIVWRPATSISVTTTDRKMMPGSTYQISYVVLPSGNNDGTADNISFASQDSTIASVDAASGLVTAIKPGITKVVVTLNRRAKEPITSEIQIRVSNIREYIPISSSEYLTYEIVDSCYNDLVLFRSALKEWETEEWKLDIPEIEIPQTSGNQTPVFLTGQILNTIESDIDIIQNVLPEVYDSADLTKVNLYYNAAERWVGDISDGYRRLERWVNWFAEALMLIGVPETVEYPVAQELDEDGNITAYIITDEYGNATRIPVDEAQE